jgi:chemotaxis protein CheD
MTPEEVVNVGIGEFRVAKGKYVLRTILGSCVGVIVYDKVNKAGGLAHVYLPDSTSYEGRFQGTREAFGNKFADVLIPGMIKELEGMGGRKKYLTAYIVGGASLFNVQPGNSFNIGEKNLESVRSVLKGHGIPFFELHVGGNRGRRVLFNLTSGDIDIKHLGERE